jgi:hypothetical protein
MATTDLALAATLMSLGHGIDGIQIILEGERKRAKGWFLFQDTEELRACEKDYWSSKCLVEPKVFVTHQRSLKTKVNQEIERIENGG